MSSRTIYLWCLVAVFGFWIIVGELAIHVVPWLLDTVR